MAQNLKIVLRCEYCMRVVASDLDYTRHLTRVHHYNVMHDIDTFTHKCLTCHRSFRLLKQLRAHLEVKHQFDSKKQELEFEDINEFKRWLEQISLQEKVRYTLLRSKKRSCDDRGPCRVYDYGCNRSGTSRKPRRTTRAMRKQGSRKINHVCTSQIQVIQSEITGTCYVTYYKTHYQHDTEYQHMNLLKSEKDEIVRRIKAGETINEIWQNLRSNVDEADVQRINSVTKHQIYLIMRKVTGEGTAQQDEDEEDVDDPSSSDDSSD